MQVSGSLRGTKLSPGLVLVHEKKDVWPLKFSLYRYKVIADWCVLYFSYSAVILFVCMPKLDLYKYIYICSDLNRDCDLVFSVENQFLRLNASSSGATRHVDS